MPARSEQKPGPRSVGEVKVTASTSFELKQALALGGAGGGKGTGDGGLGAFVGGGAEAFPWGGAAPVLPVVFGGGGGEGEGARGGEREGAAPVLPWRRTLCLCKGTDLVLFSSMEGEGQQPHMEGAA